VFKSRVVKNTLDPMFEQTFRMALPDAVIHSQSHHAEGASSPKTHSEGERVRCVIEVWDWDRFGEDDLIGRADIDLLPFVLAAHYSSQSSQAGCPLARQRSRQDADQGAAGRVEPETPPACVHEGPLRVSSAKGQYRKRYLVLSRTCVQMFASERARADGYKPLERLSCLDMTVEEMAPDPLQGAQEVKFAITDANGYVRTCIAEDRVAGEAWCEQITATSKELAQWHDQPGALTGVSGADYGLVRVCWCV
jgi:hypothetical protein